MATHCTIEVMDREDSHMCQHHVQQVTKLGTEERDTEGRGTEGRDTEERGTEGRDIEGRGTEGRKRMVKGR